MSETNGTPQTVNAIRAALLAAGIDPKGSRNKAALARRLAKATGGPLPPLAPKARAKLVAKQRPKKKAKKTAAVKTKAAPIPRTPRVRAAVTRAFDIPTDRGFHQTRAPKETVAEVKKLAAKGTSLRGICAALAEGGFVTSKGSKAWFPSSVQAILRTLVE